MIKYIGSKRALVPWILEVFVAIERAHPLRTVADPFSGSARVAHALKERGYLVQASDSAHYAATVARALIEADARRYPPSRIRPLLRELQALPPRRGYLTETFCERARFFHPDNGARMDAIRAAIPRLAAGDPVLMAILLYALLRASDRVDSTAGVQMAYLKRWAPRASNPLELRLPPLLPGPGTALRADALALAPSLTQDAVYLDPPYNQHAYLANYHVWESVVLDDRPEVYGVACKRIDCKTRKSPFNSKRQAPEAMRRLLASIPSPVLVLSFSDEGFIPRADLERWLRARGRVTVLTRPHARYVGARIGIYNPAGEKVGKISHTKNREHLFVATEDRAVHEALAPLAAASGLP